MLYHRTEHDSLPVSPGRYLVHSGAKALEKAEQSYNAAAQESDCWESCGGGGKSGYPQFSFCGEKTSHELTIYV